MTVNGPGQLGNGNLGNAVVGELSNCDGASAPLRCTTEHPVAALRLQKAASIALASIGDVVNYTFTLTNTGSVPLTGVAVNDPLPGMSAPVCAQANLAPGANTTCTASRTVTNADAVAGQVQNTATATAGYTGGGQVISNQASATVQVNARSELSITKTAPLIANVGDTIEYVITVKNTGPNDSNPTIVTDTLPSGVSFQFALGACTSIQARAANRCLQLRQPGFRRHRGCEHLRQGRAGRPGQPAPQRRHGRRPQRGHEPGR